MSKKVLSRITSALLIAAGCFLFALLAVPFIYAINRHGNTGQFNCFVTLRTTAPALDWFDMQPGGDFHFAKVIIEALTIVAMVLIVGAIGVGIAALIKPENKLLRILTLALLIALVAVGLLIFAASVVDAVITVKYKNTVKMYTPYPFGVLLATCVVAFVFFAKAKKAA